MELTLVLVVCYTFLLAAGQLLLKIGVDSAQGFKGGEIARFFPVLLKIIKNPYLISGIAIMSSSFFLWIYILSKTKLGIVFPLTALTYILVAGMSYFILGEKFSSLNYLGMFLVALGIALLLHR